jgi:hypothetical protein
MNLQRHSQIEAKIGGIKKSRRSRIKHEKELALTGFLPSNQEVLVKN